MYILNKDFFKKYVWIILFQIINIFTESKFIPKYKLVFTNRYK